MQIGIVGLGKMGFNFALRLLEKGWHVVGFNRDGRPREELARSGGVSAASFEELSAKLTPPRIVLLSIPHNAIEEVLFGKTGLAGYLAEGDMVIDAANSYYKNSIGHYTKLKETGVHYLDMGVSGGPGGARYGASIMVGGDEAGYKKVERVFNDLAQKDGFGYVGPVGAGHFAKMVHNGIEYGMMQAIAEGFTVLARSPFKFNLNQVAKIYNHGAVTESRLMGWLEQALETYGQELSKVSGSVTQTGEGAWTVETAKELGVETPIIAGSVEFRSQSEKKPSFAGKVLTALRNQFGGHPIGGKSEKT